MVDEGTRKSLQSIPLLQTRASPRDKDLWVQRLKEELMALIKVTYDSCISCFVDSPVVVRSMFKTTRPATVIGSD